MGDIVEQYVVVAYRLEKALSSGFMLPIEYESHYYLLNQEFDRQVREYAETVREV